MPSELLQHYLSIRRELWTRTEGEFSLREWRDAISRYGLIDDVNVVETILGDESVFLWQPLLGQYIPIIFESGRFPHLATTIEVKLPTLLWQEVAEAASINPDCAKRHIETLTPTLCEESARVVASLMAGIAKSDREWVNDRTFSLFEGNNIELSASLRSIQLCTSTKTPLHDSLVDAVLKMDVPHDEMTLKCYLSCLYSVYDIAPRDVEGRMLQALRSGPDWAKSTVIQHASFLPSCPTQFRVQISKEILAEGKKELLRPLSMLLIQIYKDERDYPLAAIRSMAESEYLSLNMGQMDGYLLSEIGRIDRSAAFRAIDSWFDDIPSDVLLFQIPDLLLGVFDKHPGELIDLTHRWDEEQLLRFGARTQLLREILCKRVDNDADSIVLRCAEEIVQIADLSPAQYARAVEGENDIGYWALRVLKAITSPWGKIDYDQVFRNLARFPNIKYFLGTQWLEKMRSRGADDVRILHMLDCDDNGHLAYWDDVFRFLDPRKPGIGRLRGDLQRYWRIQDTLSEAEIISRLTRTYPVDVKISVPGLKSVPDLRPHLTNQSPILEIYTPEEERRLLYAGGGELDTERMKKKILEKFNKQFKAGASSISDPVVFVIHDEGIGLHDYDVMNIFFGTLGMTVFFDKASGKVVGKRAERKDDSIQHLDADASLISGFLVYQRSSRKNFDKALHVEYYPNPAAWHPLTQQSIEELCSALTNDWTARNFTSYFESIH